jgi:hypothetical protein
MTASLPTAESVLDLIQALPPAEKDRLASALDIDPCPLGPRWSVIPRDVLYSAVALATKHQLAGTKHLVSVIKKQGALNRIYRRGPETKKQRTDKLLAAIRLAIELGTPRKPSAILEALAKRDDADEIVYRKRGGERKLLSRRTIANLLSRLD